MRSVEQQIDFLLIEYGILILMREPILPLSPDVVVFLTRKEKMSSVIFCNDIKILTAKLAMGVVYNIRVFVVRPEYAWTEALL